MNIVFLDAFTTISNDLNLNLLKGLGEVSAYSYSTREEGIERAKYANIVISNKFVIDDECLEHWTKCEYICVAATGYNNVDLEACKNRSIEVSNVRGYSTFSVVQHVFALLFGHLNRTEGYADKVVKGRWQKSRDFTFYDHNIQGTEGLVMGVYGLGAIGAIVAKVADAFGMKVIGVSKYPNRYNGPATLVDAETLLKESNVLSLHVPLNEITNQMINKETLQLMNSKAILINTSRGPLINEEHLSSHLDNNQGFTALLDVLSDEPPKISNVLIGKQNCHITPHQAWASVNARQKLINGIRDNIQAFITGQPINLI